MVKSINNSTGLVGFYSEIQNLSIKIGSFGGRYFFTQAGKIYSLNDVVRIFNRIHKDAFDKLTELDSIENTKKIVTHIRNLDVEGNNVLNETLEKKTIFYKRIDQTFDLSETIFW